MRILVRGALLGLVAVMATASVSAKEGEITKYLRGVLPVFDADGTEIKRVRANSLPKTLDVVGYNDLGYLGVSIEGSTVYLRRADVLFDGPATCKLSAQSQRSSLGKAAGTPGMRAGAGASGNPCVPVKKP